MSQIAISLTISESTLRQAKAVAMRSGRAVTEILADWLGDYGANHLPVEHLPDEDIIALCQSPTNPILLYELRDLLARHRANSLSREQSVRMDALLRDYRRTLIRKTRAFEIAESRGLLAHNGL